MKFKIILLNFLFVCMPCLASAQPEIASTTCKADNKLIQDCTKIASSLQRLACFDKAACTPPAPNTEASKNTPTRARSEMMQLVMANEAKRSPEDSHFILSETQENDEGTRIVISAPALGAVSPRPYLVISCVLNISRLQIVSEEPVNRGIVNIKLLLDNRPINASSPWQVLSTGELVDAGRGLHAIDTIRRLAGGQRLSIQSDYEPFNGLVFDAADLGKLIERERQACHW